MNLYLFYIYIKKFSSSALLRLLKVTASTATCWGSSCRPSRKDWAFPKSSWTRRTAWQHTGNSERGRCVPVWERWLDFYRTFAMSCSASGSWNFVIVFINVSLWHYKHMRGNFLSAVSLLCWSMWCSHNMGHLLLIWLWSCSLKQMLMWFLWPVVIFLVFVRWSI